MPIAENTKVAIHYTLTDDNGKVIDSSIGKEPLNYIQGRGMIVVGLEKAMYGKEVGEKFNVDVIPSEGYGEHNPELVRPIPKSAFQADSIEPGMTFYANTPNGPLPLTVSRVEGDNVIIDMNHELAGKTLHFAIEVVKADPMSAEELQEFEQHAGHHCCGRHKHGDGECCGKHEHGDGECCGKHEHGDGECCGKHEHGDGECCGKHEHGDGECCGKHEHGDGECCCKNSADEK